MKKLSLQWRITLMTVLLIGITCVSMNLLLCCSGRHYMDSIGTYISETDNTDNTDKDKQEFFVPDRTEPDQQLTIIIDGAQEAFIATNWYITAAVTLLSGVIAYFLSGHTLKPLRRFASQVEQIHPNNLSDMKFSEDVLPEFQKFSSSFNRMLDRLDDGFTAQRQFTGNAAHELRTPLALMQAQLELFTAEHPEMSSDTSDFLRLLGEQTEKMAQMTKTLLDMSELRTVACTDHIQLAPLVEEIFTDLAPLAENAGICLEHDGDGVMTGSDTLIYRLLFNLTENAIRYNRPNGTVRICVSEEADQLIIRVSDTGCGIPKEYRESIFQPFFRVDKSRSREYGGAGLGLSLVWEIVSLHSGEIYAEESSENGTTMTVKFAAESDCCTDATVNNIRQEE
mgnify:FL=1